MFSFIHSKLIPMPTMTRNWLMGVAQLANALSQNCGIKMHKELASRSFTDALLRLANDRVRARKTTAEKLLLINVLSEYASASQSQDIGADGGMGRNVLQRSRSRHHGAGIYETEVTK